MVLTAEGTLLLSQVVTSVGFASRSETQDQGSQKDLQLRVVKGEVS